MSLLDTVREKYPQYKNVDDETLANALAKKSPKYKETLTQEGFFGQKKEALPKGFIQANRVLDVMQSYPPTQALSQIGRMSILPGAEVTLPLVGGLAGGAAFPAFGLGGSIGMGAGAGLGRMAAEMQKGMRGEPTIPPDQLVKEALGRAGKTAAIAEIPTMGLWGAGKAIGGIRALSSGKPLRDLAHKTVLTIRNSKLAEKVAEAGQKIWEPVKNISAKISGKSFYDEAVAEFGENSPQLNRLVEAIGKGTEKLKSSELSSQEVLAALDDVGRIPKSQLAGTQRYSQTSYEVGKLKNFLYGQVKKNVSEEERVAIDAARTAWKEHATQADKLYQKFGLGAAKTAPTNTGVRFLESVVSGNPYKSDIELVQAVEKALGQEILPQLAGMASKVRMAQTLGHIAKYAAIYGPAGMFAGALMRKMNE